MTSRRWSSCQRKRSYKTVDEATRAITRMKHIYGVDIGEPYPCEYGLHYHTGHYFPGDRYLESKQSQVNVGASDGHGQG